MTDIERQLEQLNARVALLEQENKQLKSTMIAAAEEIALHWDAHCEEDGYGPSNLIQRLEKGIPAKYSYSAGDFVRLESAVVQLSEYVESLVAQLYRVAPEHRHVECKYLLSEVQQYMEKSK